ncbi:MAG: TrkH family potassium uptake protein [Clostridia bacterium]|nr:TrkH family potassium uptake protein [Clostridia bacterium]
MNHRMVFYTLGKVVLIESALLVPSLIVSLIYKNSCVLPFVITIAVAFAAGMILSYVFKPKTKVIYAKEGFVTVALAWIVMSLIGALPFYLSKEIPSYIDAFFETVSGFTTTGASIASDVEAMSEGILFWRSFTHWVGGMGVLVFLMAVVPSDSDRSIHLLRAEVPGPTFGKFVPRISKTAKLLYIIYIVLTALEALLLVCGDMNLFESLVHAFGTAGTGGFSVKSESIGAYSAYSQWVISVFMLMFGLNFNLYYLIIIKRVKTALKSEELWMFMAIVAVATCAIAANIHKTVSGLEEAFRASAFQVATIISTTGYATTNFDLWPNFSKGILFVLMFIGGCAGSTAGGLKIARVMVVFKLIKREFRHMLHPRSVGVVKIEGKRVSEDVLKSVSAYFGIYIICVAALFLLICYEPFDFQTNISAVVACFNNVGPGFGAVGPAMNYEKYSAFSKIVLSFAMLLGRLEIYPIIFTFIPSAWSRKK